MRKIFIPIILILLGALVAGVVVLKGKTTAVWKASVSSDGYTIVMNKDSMFNFVNDNGDRYTFFYRFSDCMPFSEGYTFVKVDTADTWSMIDTKGNAIGDLSFLEVRPFKNGYAWVRTEDGSANLIDSDCELIFTQGKYSEVARGISDDILIVQGNDGLYGYATLDGYEFIRPVYKYAEPFKHGLASVKRGDYMTLIDSTGSQLCPAVFAGFEITEEVVFPYVKEYEDKYGHPSQRKLYGLMTKEGEWLLPCCFVDYKTPSEGILLMASQASPSDTCFYKYFSMSDGKELFNTSFHSASSFQDGKARVESFEEVYDIDSNGNVLIDENEKWLLGTWITEEDEYGYSIITFGLGGKVHMSFYDGYSGSPYRSDSGTYTIDEGSVTLQLEDGPEYCTVSSPISMSMGSHQLAKIDDLDIVNRNLYLNEYTYNDEMYMANPMKRGVSQWYIGQWTDASGNKVQITDDEFIFIEKGAQAEKAEYIVSGPTVKASIGGYGSFTLIQSSMIIKVQPALDSDRLSYSTQMYFADGKVTRLPVEER